MNVVSVKELAEFFNERRERAEQEYRIAEGAIERLVASAIKEQAEKDYDYWNGQAGE